MSSETDDADRFLDLGRAPLGAVGPALNQDRVQASRQRGRPDFAQEVRDLLDLVTAGQIWDVSRFEGPIAAAISRAYAAGQAAERGEAAQIARKEEPVPSAGTKVRKPYIEGDARNIVYGITGNDWCEVECDREQGVACQCICQVQDAADAIVALAERMWLAGQAAGREKAASFVAETNTFAAQELAAAIRRAGEEE